MTKLEKVLCVIGGITLVVVGIMVVPKLLKKYTGKLYKNSHGEIDFNDFGPELVKKDTKGEGKNRN